MNHQYKRLREGRTVGRSKGRFVGRHWKIESEVDHLLSE